MAMGDLLADEVKRILDEKGLSVDVVIPVSCFISKPVIVAPLTPLLTTDLIDIISGS